MRRELGTVCLSRSDERLHRLGTSRSRGGFDPRQVPPSSHLVIVSLRVFGQIPTVLAFQKVSKVFREKFFPSV